MKKRFLDILHHLVAYLIGIVWVLPFMGIIMASIRPLSEIVNGWWNFDNFTLTFKNFIEVWNYSSAPVSRGILNSLLISIPSTILPLIAASLAGYAFARFKFPLRNFLFSILIFLMAMPAQAIIIPLFFQMARLGLIDNRIGLILLHTAWGVSWCTVFLRNFFLSIPLDLEEAAMVDGASNFTIFWRIALPLALPAIISVAVLQFIWVWNDFFFALVLIISPDKFVVTQTIPLIKGRYLIDWGLVSAASIIAIIPPLLIFSLLQKYYIKGIMAGAVKG